MLKETETYYALVVLLKAQIEIRNDVPDEELNAYLQEIGVCVEHMRERMIKKARYELTKNN